MSAGKTRHELVAAQAAGSSANGVSHASVPRLALGIDEAAEALGISRDHLERHVLRDLRVIYTGRRRLIPVSELERWAERQAVSPVAAPRAR